MYCNKCGASIPDDSVFCPKCGAKQVSSAGTPQAPSSSPATATQGVIAASGVTELKCPGCGAPIKPQIGEMLITCEYCGASISLANEGWKSIESNTMLPLVLDSEDKVLQVIKGYMDRGLLHRHLEEKSKNEGVILSVVPYWIVPVSARTKYTAVDTGVEVEKVAGTAILAGLLGGAMGGGRSGFGGGLLEGTMMGGMMMGGFGGGGSSIRAYSLDQNYNYPVVAVKGLLDYQPRNYAFDLKDRVIFDASKLQKGIKVLNGDVGEDSAKYEAKTNVDQVQSQKVHQQHHSVRSITTDVDISDPELMHVPVWFAKFDSSGKKVVLVIDGHSGKLINSMGLE